MKNCRNLKAVLLCLMSLSMFFIFSFSVFADAIIVADDMFNRGFSRMMRTEDGAHLINVYVSNLAEAGIDYYDRDETSDDDLYKLMYKHLELNGFGEIKKDADNQEYCTVKSDTFERECFHVFHRYIDAGNVPGYKDGYVNFLVNDYAPTITVLALCDEFAYNDNGYYSGAFTVYKVDGSASDYYSTTSFELYDFADKNPAEKIGSGNISVYYPYNDGREYSADDIELCSFYMDASGIPYTEENTSYEPVEKKAKQQETNSTVKTETEKLSVESSAKSVEKTETSPNLGKKNETNSKNSNSSSNSNLLIITILIAACIVLVAVSVTLLIVLIKKKKDNH